MAQFLRCCITSETPIRFLHMVTTHRAGDTNCSSPGIYSCSWIDPLENKQVTRKANIVHSTQKADTADELNSQHKKLQFEFDNVNDFNYISTFVAKKSKVQKILRNIHCQYFLMIILQPGTSAWLANDAKSLADG